MSEFSPREAEFCQSCDPAGMCVNCLEYKMYATHEGQLLNQNPPRYINFAWEDQRRFREYLGADVDPLLHGPYQAREVAIPMIEHQNLYTEPFSWEETKLLVIAHTLHDYHEGVTGDIPFPQKTPEGDAAELELNASLVAKILHVEDEGWMGRYKDTLAGKDKVGRAFDCGEKIGYFLTGLKAWHLRVHQGLTQDERDKSAVMGRDVCASALGHMLRHSAEFSYPDHLIEIHQHAIEQMEI